MVSMMNHFEDLYCMSQGVSEPMVAVNGEMIKDGYDSNTIHRWA